MKYQIENNFGKYIIHKTGDDVPGKYGLYLSKIKKDGSYEWVYDYTYAKRMTLKTAEKHLKILEK
jgi:hypothetical protein